MYGQLRQHRLPLALTRPLGWLPGLAFCALIALAARVLAELPLPALATLGPLTLAMLLGLLVGQRLPTSTRASLSAGTALARQRLLRIGIVLYGLRIALDSLLQIGLPALLTDLAVVGGIFMLAGWVGTRWLGLERRTALLIGAGSAVCGAAAILAIAPALRARPQTLPVAIATVVLFGTAAMLLYPWLWSLPAVQALFDGSATAFGRYVGATVHEVAQVAAIGASLEPSAGETAVVTKLIRVMLLVPLILIVARLFRAEAHEAEQRPVAVPWFALLFMLMPLVRASGLLDATWLEWIRQLDNLLLAMAMAALGLETRFADLRSSGLRPLLLGALLFLTLVIAGLGVTLLAGMQA